MPRYRYASLSTTQITSLQRHVRLLHIRKCAYTNRQISLQKEYLRLGNSSGLSNLRSTAISQYTDGISSAVFVTRSQKYILHLSSSPRLILFATESEGGASNAPSATRHADRPFLHALSLSPLPPRGIRHKSPRTGVRPT